MQRKVKQLKLTKRTKTNELPQMRYFKGLIALLDPYLSKSCGYGPLINLNTKQPPMF